MTYQYSTVPNENTVDDIYAQVQLQEISFFNQNFPTQYKLTAKLRHLSNRAVVYLAQNIKKRNKDLKTIYQYEQNFDIVLQLPEHNQIWTKFTDSHFKLHYDHSKELALGPLGNWHIYGSFSSTRKIKNSSFKLGAFHNFSYGVVDIRSRFNIGEARSQQYVYAKTWLEFFNLKFGLIGVFDLNRKFLQKSEVSLGYRHNQSHWIGGQLECKEFRNYQINYSRFGSYFDSLRLGYVYKQDNLKVGLGYNYNIEQGQTKKIKAAVQYWTQTPVKWAKVSFNSLMQAGLAVHVQSANIPNLVLGFSWLNVTKSLKPNSASLTLEFNS